MKMTLFVWLFILLAPGARADFSGDAVQGKRFHDANCMGCHDTGVYTRKGHIVRSTDALRNQLASCGHATGKMLSTTDTQNLLEYLNDQFYHFR